VLTAVLGRAGSLKQVAATAAVTLRPAAGAHFHCARRTQDDGTLRWSAPVRVTQQKRRSPTLKKNPENTPYRAPWKQISR